jgi:curli biogenesis system outer membrane secretion channel CsgG
MKRIFCCSLVIALALAGSAFGKAIAQGGSDPSVVMQNGLTPAEVASGVGVPVDQSVAPTVSLPVEPSVAPVAVHAEKPALMVMGFESGTVSAQVGNNRGGFFGRKGGNEKYDPSQLGTGIADMLIEKLLATGQFRLLERKPLESASGAQYIVTGSVTRFGFDDRNFGGLIGTVATMGMLSYKQNKTEVTLTARIINAATGEIVASMTSKGVSGKGGGLRVFGMGSNGAGGGDVSSSNFRSTAIGQATDRAVANLAEQIVQKKASF